MRTMLIAALLAFVAFGVQIGHAFAGTHNEGSISLSYQGQYAYIWPSAAQKPGAAMTVQISAYESDWSLFNQNTRFFSTAEGGGYTMEIGGPYLRFVIYAASGYRYSPAFNLRTLESGWHTFTGIFDGRYVKLYVDGDLIGSTLIGSSTYWLSHSSMRIMLGIDPTGSTYEANTFRGNLDEFRMYNRALSDEEVKTYYNRYLTGSEDGLVGLYRLDESGAALVDSSPTQNNGALYNAVRSEETPDLYLTPPAMPTGLQGTAGYGHAALSWNPNVPDSNLAGYNVYADGERVTPSPILATSYNVNLANNISHVLEVSAAGKDGSESVKASVTVTPDGLPPGKPSGLLVASGDGNATMAWNENTEPDLAGYHVYLNGTRVTAAPITTPNYNFTELTNGLIYDVAVTAVDAVGNESDKATGKAKPIPPDTTPPSKPGGLQATAGNGEALLEWAPNPEPDVAGYDIFVDGVKWTSVPLLKTHTYMVQGLTNGQTYSFTIRAIDTSGNLSPLSESVTATLDTTVPDRPKALQVISGNKKVTVSWSSENRMPVTHYLIYRDGELLDTITGTSYVDETVVNGNDYEYRVQAVNDDGTSLASIGYGGPREGLADLTGISLPFTVWGMLQTALNFLRLYGVWILLALGVIFAVVMLETPKKAVDSAAGRKGKGKRKVDQSGGYVMVGNKRVNKAEWEQTSKQIRRDMYDYMTKAGRIQERDEWVAKTGNPYGTPKTAQTVKASFAQPVKPVSGVKTKKVIYQGKKGRSK